MRVICLTFLFFATGYALFAQAVDLNKNGWNCILNEDFNTSGAAGIQDLKQRWKFIYGPGGSNPSVSYPAYENTNVSINNGQITFYSTKLSSPLQAMDPNTNTARDYWVTSSSMESSVDLYPNCISNSPNGFLYGMFEIRCKLPAKENQAPAFWLNGTRSWPPEIDVFEFNGAFKNQFFSTHHWGSVNYYTSLSCSNTFKFPYDLTADFHTWTCVWSPYAVTYFLDSKELWTDNDPAHIPGNGQITLPGEICAWSKAKLVVGLSHAWADQNAVSNLDPFVVDYVKVYVPNSYENYTTGSMTDWFNTKVLASYANTPYTNSHSWRLNRIKCNTDVYNVTAGSNIAVAQNGNKYFYKGSDGLLWTTYKYDFGSGPQFYAAAFANSPVIDGDVFCVTPSEIVFYRKNAQVQYLYNSSFYTISSSTNVAKIVYASSDGLKVAFVGTNNALYECTRSSITSHTWSQTAIFSGVKQEVVADLSVANTYYAISTTNQLRKIYKLANTWTSVVLTTQSTHQPFSSLAMAMAGDKIFYKTSGNLLCYLTRPNSSSAWTATASFDAILPAGSTPQNVTNVSGDIIVSNANPYFIIYKGTDDLIWIISYYSGNWWSAPISWFNQALDIEYTYDPVAAKICYVGTDQQIRTYEWAAYTPTLLSCSQGLSLRPAEADDSMDDPDIGNVPTNVSSDLVIWPNPTSNQITLSLANENWVIASVNVTDAQGKSVFEWKGEAQSSISFDFNTLQPGLYTTVLVTADGKILTENFMKGF